MTPPRAHYRTARTLAGLALTVAVGCGAEPEPTPAPPVAPPPARAEFVGGSACAACHAEVRQAWTGSHHDLAMQEATPETALGDFADVRFGEGEAAVRFRRRDDALWVEAIGADGERDSFRVRYTFGVDPLQQYLVETSGGRLQALTVAWDARPEEVGGQRWFSLQPEPAPPGDVLHWSGAGYRWNDRCAHCHSTGVRKGYDPASGRYDTRYREVDVGCESCHGPASLHVTWAEAGADPAAESGLVAPLTAEPAQWTMDPESGIARRVPARERRAEIERCASCHARRTLLTEDPLALDFLDAHHPALLDEGLYFADGQIRDEVYVYGSFLQSAMYRAGVSCGDCHEPHSLALREETPDGVCAQCHAPERFASPEHHHHSEDSEGASCVGCHMPTRTYMGLDARRDHGFRVPRPDVAARLGTPEPCSGCHAGRDARWAAEVVASWGGARAGAPHFADALHAGRIGDPEAGRALRRLAGDDAEPGIVRATALALLGELPGGATRGLVASAAASEEPLLRMTAVRAAEALPPERRFAQLEHLLDDPLRAVRIEAGRLLSSSSPEDPRTRHRLGRALAEYEAVQRLHADRPASHLNLGLLSARRGDTEGAEAAYRRAIELTDTYVPAYVNLADLYRVLERDSQGERVLRQGLEHVPQSAALHHALGLALVRLDRHAQALPELAEAARLEPDSERYRTTHEAALRALQPQEETQ